MKLALGLAALAAIFAVPPSAAEHGREEWLIVPHHYTAEKAWSLFPRSRCGKGRWSRVPPACRCGNN
jgi:hypothetical protein